MQGYLNTIFNTNQQASSMDFVSKDIPKYAEATGDGVSVVAGFVPGGQVFTLGWTGFKMTKSGVEVYNGEKNLAQFGVEATKEAVSYGHGEIFNLAKGGRTLEFFVNLYNTLFDQGAGFAAAKISGALADPKPEK